MARIGDFGRARAIAQGEPDVFGFCGEDFEVPAGISAVVLMDFVAETKEGTAAREDALARLEKAEARLERAVSEPERVLARADAEAAQIALIEAGNRLLVGMRDYVRGCLGDNDAEWARFNRLCRQHQIDSDELMNVCGAIFSAVSARPTTRPSDSSDGPSSTGDGSTGGAGSPEGTPGPSPLATVSVVAELTPLEIQRREAIAQTVSVNDLLRSGG